MDKRGFELTISTLIILVLAILVLAALSITFTIGWQKFLSIFQGYNPSDVDTAKKACDNACVMQNNFDFCCKQREVNFGTGKQIINCTDSRLNVQCNINCNNICVS